MSCLLLYYSIVILLLTANYCVLFVGFVANAFWIVLFIVCELYFPFFDYDKLFIIRSFYFLKYLSYYFNTENDGSWSIVIFPDYTLYYELFFLISFFVFNLFFNFLYRCFYFEIVIYFYCNYFTFYNIINNFEYLYDSKYNFWDTKVIFFYSFIFWVKKLEILIIKRW